jgi:tripartite-type tricarboxylate transporter receptor subunit TctC
MSILSKRSPLKLGSPGFVYAIAHSSDIAGAADYPTRSIHLVVPYAAGGAADSIARVRAKRVGGRAAESIT